MSFTSEILRKYLGIHNLENVIGAMNFTKMYFFPDFRGLYNVKMVTKNCHVFTTAQNMVRTETLFGRMSTDENDLLL